MTAQSDTEQWIENVKGFYRALNPPKFDQEIQNTSQCIQGKFVQDHFTIFSYPYSKLAQPWTERMKAGALLLEEIHYQHLPPSEGHELLVYVYLPNSLLDSTGTVQLLIDLYGGGLFAGHPLYAEWMSLGMLQAAKQHRMPVLSFVRRMLPESSGDAPVEDGKAFMDNLIHGDSLQRCLEENNLRFTISTTNLWVTAESAGAPICLPWLWEYPDRIQSIVLRSPLVTNFVRKGKQSYRGQPYTIGDAQDNYESMDFYRKRLGPELAEAVSRQPPDCMYGSPSTFSTGNFEKEWGRKFPLDDLETIERCKGPLPFVYISQGTADTFLNTNDTETLHKLLLQKGYHCTLSMNAGEEHCFDRNLDLHGAELGKLRAWMEQQLMKDPSN